MAEDVSNKSYLGDAVYCEFNGYDLILTTEDGVELTNRIVLEPDVYKALTDYVARLGTAPVVPGSDADVIDAEFVDLPADDVPDFATSKDTSEDEPSKGNQ